MLRQTTVKRKVRPATHLSHNRLQFHGGFHPAEDSSGRSRQKYGTRQKNF